MKSEKKKTYTKKKKVISNLWRKKLGMNRNQKSKIKNEEEQTINKYNLFFSTLIFFKWFNFSFYWVEGWCGGGEIFQIWNEILQPAVLSSTWRSNVRSNIKNKKKNKIPHTQKFNKLMKGQKWLKKKNLIVKKLKRFMWEIDTL